MPVARRRKPVPPKKLESDDDEEYKEEDDDEDDDEAEKSDEESYDDDNTKKKINSKKKRTTIRRSPTRGRSNRKPAKKASIGRKKTTAKKRDSDADDDDSSVANHEGNKRQHVVFTRRNNRKVVSKQTSSNSRSKKQTSQAHSEDDEEYNENDDSGDDSKDEEFTEPEGDEDEESNADNDDDDESFEEEDEEFRPTRTSPRTKKTIVKYNRPTAHATKKISADVNDSDEDEQSFSSSSAEKLDKPRRGRFIAKKKTVIRRPSENRKGKRTVRPNPTSNSRGSKLAQTRSYKDFSDTEDALKLPFTGSATKRGRSKRKIKDDDDDEEYIPDDKEQEQDDDDESYEDELNRASEEASSVDNPNDHDDDDEEEDRHVGIVYEGDVGNPYSDESEPEQKPKEDGTEIKPYDIYDSSDDHDDDDERVQTGKKPARVSSPQQQQQYVTNCSSKEDAITYEPLPPKHVCFFSPDGKTRQCFCLNTLRQIAFSMPPKYRMDRTGGGKQTFLQPPHFRTPMSDDLLDQIASRFGRDALDLHGDYYKRKKETIQKRIRNVHGDDDEEDDASVEENFVDNTLARANSLAFKEQIEKYVNRTMGSRDIYACPICYVVSHYNLQCFLTNDNNGEKISATRPKNDRGSKYSTDFNSDPMAVLGYEDNEAFEIASAFCFTRICDVKQHLRTDHDVNPGTVRGNDLYMRFKIRAPDGLLQRYLSEHSRSDVSRHGDMMRYWFGGNNFSFVLLLSLISHAAECRDIVDDPEHNEVEVVENADKYLVPAITFFESFSDDAEAIWDAVSRPFHHETKEEIEMFIDDDSVEEVGDLSGYRTFNLQSALDEFEEDKAAAAYYDQMNKALNDDDNENDEDVSEVGEIEEESDSASEESSEEVDTWEQKIVGKIQSKVKSPLKRSGSRRPLKHSSPKKKATKERRELNGSPINLDESTEHHESRLNRNRLVLDDSEEDDVEPPLTGSSHSTANEPTAHGMADPSSAVRKRLVIRDSDDED